MTINYPALSDYEFVLKYLELTNLLLNEEQKLVLSEMQMIAAFTILPDEKFKYQRFSMAAKRKVMERLAITSATIYNRIHSLCKKGFLRKDEDKVLYLPNHVLKAYEMFKTQKEDLIFKFPRKDGNPEN